MGLSRTLALLRRIGLYEVAGLVRRRMWSSRVSFGLRAALETLPGPPRTAGIAVDMQPTNATEFGGFAGELGRVAGREALELAQRERFCRAGVRTLFVAVTESGAPIYAQWLVRSDEQDALHRAASGLFPHLAEGEALVEGAYTFADYRKLGAMADGMYQLLLQARDAGDQSVLTYVDADNVPSLRGCRNAGFVSDHVRDNRWRLGRRMVRWRPLDQSAEAIWEAAIR